MQSGFLSLLALHEVHMSLVQCQQLQQLLLITRLELLVPGVGMEGGSMVGEVSPMGISSAITFGMQAEEEVSQLNP